MPDINDKYVIYYAVKGYLSSAAVTISVYDTMGSAEVDAQTMSELGSTGIYTFNFYPRKRTTYTAVMNCTQRPFKAHQIIRIEKTKVSGAVTIPKIPIPRWWTKEDKKRMFDKLSRIATDLNYTTDFKDIQILLTEGKEVSSKITSEFAKLSKENKEISLSQKRETAELMENKLKEIKLLNNKEVKRKFDKLTNDFKEQIKELSEKTIFSRLEDIKINIIELAHALDETNANVKLYKTINSDFKKKIGVFSENADELILLLKNGINQEN